MILLRLSRILIGFWSIFILFGPRKLFALRAILCVFIPIPILIRLYSLLNKHDTIIDVMHIMGGIFLKMGQLLSTRPDIVGKKNADILSRLQDRAPYDSQRSVVDIVESELQCDIDKVFLEFGKKPIASASIAQVHMGVLKDGSIVAVKIMHRGIKKKMLQDLLILKYFAKLLMFFSKTIKSIGILDVLDEFNTIIVGELDFRMEAARTDEFRLRVADNISYIVVPKIHWEYSTSIMIVSDWIPGVPLSDKVAIQSISQKKRSELSVKILHAFLYQIYWCGFFHADPHPGNIFIMNDGRVGIIDFGAVGILSEKERYYVTMILHYFIKKDYKRVAEIHYEAGYIDKSTNIDAFVMSCRIMGESFIGVAQQDIRAGAMLAEIFNAAKRFGMKMQPQLLLLQKSLIMIEGMLFEIDSSINTWKIAEPWLERWVSHHIGIHGLCLRYVKSAFDKICRLYDKSMQAYVFGREGM